MKRTATIILTTIMLIGALALPAAAQLADPYDEVGGVVVDRPVPRVTNPATQPVPATQPGVTVPSPVRVAPVTQVRPSAQLAQTGLPAATAGLLALGLLALGGMALGASRMRSAATA